MDKFPNSAGERPLSKKPEEQIKRVENMWDDLDKYVKDNAITVVTLQTGPTGEGHEYHHSFAVRLKNGNIGFIGLPTEFAVCHAIGAGSKEGVQYRDNPDRPIKEAIEPAFMAVVHRDGTVEGDLPAEYQNLKKVVTLYGYFYDEGIWGSLKLPTSLGASQLKITESKGE